MILETADGLQRGQIIEKVKEIIKYWYKYADCGLFFTPNIAGDEMAQLLCCGGITLYICYNYSYFEVFGLTDQEERQLLKYYRTLQRAH